MSNSLMVPVYMDALYLATSGPAAEPTADFRGLPYHDKIKGRDVNSDTPWLGDTAASPPFENSNMTLQAGVHLHWSIPDGLCRGKLIEGKIVMPTVPNRWLVRRQQSSDLEEKLWVIESDYLWPQQEQAPAINILHTKKNTNGTPYRFLGRKLTLDEWRKKQASERERHSHEYLDNLTAFGHGEPTFAAYYQNCMSVFGFHDPDLAREEGWKSVYYDLVGWYGGGTEGPDLSWEIDATDTGSMIEPIRRWRIASDDTPQQLLCYSSLGLENSVRSGTSSATTGDFKVAIGDSVSEALCALLAKEIAEDLSIPELSNQFEEQLEALYIEGQLGSEAQDLGLRLRRYRHQKSFAPMQGSERWTVHSDEPDSEHLPDSVQTALRDLNDAQARYGRQLQTLEQARRQLYGDWCNYMRCVYRPPDGGRGQFLDIDEIVAFIEERSLAKVERLSSIVEANEKQLQKTKQYLEGLILEQNREEQNKPEVVANGDSGTGLATGLTQLSSTHQQYALRSVPGARFWRPADPVVLMTGGKIRLNERYGRDGRYASDDLLLCGTYKLPTAGVEDALQTDAGRIGLLNWLAAKRDTQTERSIGIRTIDAQRAWNPLFVDWGIDLHSAESHAPSVPGSYAPDVITANYKLGARNPDLQPDILWTDDDPDRFSGRCILGSTPSVVMRERIEETLQRRILDGKPETWARKTETGEEGEYYKTITEWYERSDKPVALPVNPAQMQALVAWYSQRPLNQTNQKRNQDPLYCTLLAYQKLFDNAHETGAKAEEPLRSRAFLGQALSGFNQELLQWKPGLTLPITEPIGLKPYRDFTRRVANAVGDATAWATEPTNAFSPLRSGALKLNALRLIDSFGQVAAVPCDDKVIVPTTYRLSARPGVAYLPPRLVQPARVTFRWLDAHRDSSGEMLEEAALSPICGWLLPEHVSGRLLVFNGQGQPLGALAADKNTRTLEWVRAPGLQRFSDAESEEGRAWLEGVSPTYYKYAIVGQKKAGLRDLGELGASIDNRRLARVLLYLWATRSPEFLAIFLNTLDDAMANIDPEGTTGMGSMALLVGRPVAVLGAELNLELKDEPAVRQDWTAFMLDQFRHRRDTDAFDQVRFPLRLGQFKSRNDGVLGYWREALDGFVDDTFVAQAADDNDQGRPLELEETPLYLAAKINAHDRHDKPDALNFTQSVADPPLRTTLLFDPRGRAHLTSGILPVKSIDIPRHLWEPALEAIRVWFPAGPLLSSPTQRRVPTPALVGHQWSWLERNNAGNSDSWQTVHQRPSLNRKDLHSAFTELDENKFNAFIEHLLEKGWLEEQDPNGMHLNLGTREDRQHLDDLALENPLDTLFAQLSLALVSPGDAPEFNPHIDVREGWLMLEPGKGVIEQ